ncbi:nucleoside permease [Planctomicrobium piriforme]|uniref:Nucleoside transporter n=1 Tax=Planctomicrobium piriforme TaxID=1576369 RepID=A0A1I3KV90_9PLAN|nr:nucleoside permease [Planctomicrobium piriforme]SFI76451.1 nucleoside transporter [Planctomicrobium piriforme]
MNVGLLVRLSIMMFLQFFVWGSWYATVGNYMGAHEMSGLIAWAYSVGPIAAIAAPLFLGLIADRYFATERVLGIMHLLGAVTLFMAPQFSGTAFIWILLIHMLCYMPTLGLTNTLAFHHITNAEKEFPIVRVAGTFGWIAAGVLVSSFLKADKLDTQFYLASGASVLLGLYSFTLPHTAPPAKGQPASISSILGFDSIKMMKSPNFAVFIIGSFLVCIPLSTYYAFAPVFVAASGSASPATTMSFGQMSEVFFMLAMPMFFARLGVKWMLLVGMLAWVVRYGLFAGAAASGAYWMVLGGVLLHGICYDFFFVTGYIYVDKRADKNIRGQAQSFLVLVTQGLGMLIGAQISGFVLRSLDSSPNPVLTMPQWQTFWIVPCVMAAVVMLVFGLLFRDDTAKLTEAEIGEGLGHVPAATDVI